MPAEPFASDDDNYLCKAASNVKEATFAGTNSYYSSSVVIHLTVGKTAVSPAVTPAPTPVPTSGPMSSVTTPTPVPPASPSPNQAVQPSTNASPTITYVAISAAVIIIAVIAAAIVLKRRKS